MADFKLPKVGAAFPVFCQRIIPLTFDNSLSYLEFLGHVNVKLNEVICALNAQGVAIQDLANLIDSTLDAFKAEILELIETNREEIMQAIEDLRTDLQGEIQDLTQRVGDNETAIGLIQGEITAIQEDIRDIEEQIAGLDSGSGSMTYLPVHEFDAQNFSVELTSAAVHIYYRAAGGTDWTPIADTSLATIAYWCANVDPADLGTNDVLFIFDSFPLTKGAQFITTGEYTNEDFTGFYDIDSIPAESFNAGLTLCSTSTSSGSGTDVIITTTGSETPAHYSALMISNAVAEVMREGAIFQIYYIPLEGGQLLYRQSGALVSPVIQIDDTLHYTNGVLGAVSPFERLTQAEWDLITPAPDKLYFVTGVNGDVNMYYGSLRMGAAYAVGDVSSSLINGGNAVVGNFEIMEV